MKDNMMFWIRENNAEDMSFVAGLELEGVEIHAFGNCIRAYGLSAKQRRYIEFHYRIEAL